MYVIIKWHVLNQIRVDVKGCQESVEWNTGMEWWNGILE